MLKGELKINNEKCKMKYKGWKIVLLIFLSINGNLFSQVNVPDTAVEVSCQFYLDSILKKQVYIFADKKAEFPGGEIAMMQFIQSNLKYPCGLVDISGTIFVEFVVNEDGKIVRKGIRKSLYRPMDEEAFKVVDQMPKFIPAQCDGKAVPFLMVIPIKFVMN
jgi:TonB family protein